MAEEKTGAEGVTALAEADALVSEEGDALVSET